jgi:arylsulfatase A-like enzyme
LIWYCGDNGTPNEAVATVPFRAQKGSIYEGGIRVPGIIEWPSKTKQPKTLKARAVTSDILPTLCEIARIPLPDRPLDGMNLLSLEDTRSKPIGFWNFVADSRDRRPYIAPELQEGTTPLAKKQNGKATRNFRNDRFESIDEVHYQGARAIISNHWKLVVDGTRQSGQELFDLDKDPKESVDLSSQFPAVASRLAAELRDWQSSVLNSLIEKDYR